MTFEASSPDQLKVGIEFIDWDRARVVAQRGAHVVEKEAVLGGLALKVCKDEEQQQAAFAYEITREIREIDRDIAFLMFGKDFRKHCALQSNFWGMMTEEERRNVGIDI